MLSKQIGYTFEREFHAHHMVEVDYISKLSEYIQCSTTIQLLTKFINRHVYYNRSELLHVQHTLNSVVDLGWTSGVS